MSKIPKSCSLFSQEIGEKTWPYIAAGESFAKHAGETLDRRGELSQKQAPSQF